MPSLSDRRNTSVYLRSPLQIEATTAKSRDLPPRAFSQELGSVRDVLNCTETARLVSLNMEDISESSQGACSILRHSFKVVCKYPVVLVLEEGLCIADAWNNGQQVDYLNDRVRQYWLQLALGIANFCILCSH